MLHSIWDDIKQEFDYGNMIKRIIIVNIAVYVIVNLVWLFTPASYQSFYQEFVHFFSVGGSWWHNLTHPWVPFTHMFLHEGFFHILWNMLFLFWFGRIFGDLLGDRRVLPLYILGGLAGAAFYFIVANIPGIAVGEVSDDVEFTIWADPGERRVGPILIIDAMEAAADFEVGGVAVVEEIGRS